MNWIDVIYGVVGLFALAWAAMLFWVGITECKNPSMLIGRKKITRTMNWSRR